MITGDLFKVNPPSHPLRAANKDQPPATRHVVMYFPHSIVSSYMAKIKAGKQK